MYLKEKNLRRNELCITSMLSILKYIILQPSTSVSLQPPIPSLSLYFYLPPPADISPSPPLAPCPHPTLAVGVTESYPSCHQKGNVRQRQGGTGGGDRMMLQAVLASALACCLTLAGSVFCTPDSSSLPPAVSGVTPHELHYTPIPDIQLISVRCH